MSRCYESAPIDPYSQLESIRDSQLAEYRIQVVADRSLRHSKVGTYLTICAALADQQGDLAFATGQELFFTHVHGTVRLSGIRKRFADPHIT